MSELIFTPDNSDGRYWVDGRRVVSVTEVFDAHGLISPFAKDMWRANLGSVIHMAGALYVSGSLDINTVDERVAPYLESYIRLLDHTKWVAKTVEQHMFNPDIWLAGTFDVAFEREDDILADLKSGGESPTHKLQTALYAYLWKLPCRRFAIYLQGDGSIAKLKEHTDRNDLKYALAFVSTYHWMEKHGY